MSSEDSDDESEAASDSSSDSSYMDDESSSTSDSYGSSAMDVDGPDDEDELSILTVRNASKWCRKWLSTADGQNLIMTRWRDALRDYHFCAQPPKVSVIQVWDYYEYNYHIFQAAEASVGRRQEAAVTSLREMRAVRKKYYDNNGWRRRVKVW